MPPAIVLSSAPPVIRVYEKRHEAKFPDDATEKVLCKFRAFGFFDTPADNLSGEDVEDDIGKEEYSFHIGLEPRDVPTPHLIRAGCHQFWRLAVPCWFPAFSSGGGS